MRRNFEFAIVVMLVTVLAVLLMQALRRAQGDLEEAGVQADAAAIRSQLLEVVAHHEVFGGTFPSSDNPLDWVSNRPANYRGVLEQAPEEKHVWYFDSSRHELIYRFRDGHVARFRLNRDAGRAGLRGSISGLGLQRLDVKND